MTESTVGRVVPAPSASPAPPNGGSTASPPPALNATLVELHLGPAIDPANFPVSLDMAKEAFQSIERWQRYIEANQSSKEVNAKLKACLTAISRLKKAIDERENEIRIDPTFAEQLAGKNEAERNARLAKVTKTDDAYKALSAELLKAEDERNSLSVEFEGLEGDVRLHQTVSAETCHLLQFSAMAIAAPNAAAAYLS